MAEGKPSIGSYVYCMGNPITMIDPDGNWERNSNGNLVAQKGDNAVTLGKYLGIDKREALGVLTSKWSYYRREWGSESFCRSRNKMFIFTKYHNKKQYKKYDKLWSCK